jgi:hypothetical protein
MPKPLYVLRVRQPDGSWVFDMDRQMTKREATRESARNRIWLGVLCQVWNQQEAAEIVERENAAPKLGAT